MWLLVIFEYLKITGKISLIINATLSGVICFGIFYISCECNLNKNIDQFINNSTGVLSLLVGFTVAMFTLLITASNPNIDKIKTVNSGAFLYKKPVSIFKMLLIRTVYIILIESILLLFNLVYPFFFNSSNLTGKIFFGIDVFIMAHIIIASITNTVELYFILTKTDKHLDKPTRHFTS